MKQIEQTITTVEIAEMMKTEHYKILEKLEGTKDKKTKGVIPTMTAHEIVVSDYFTESTYKDGSGKVNKCYKVTKLGCDFLANKFTGEKGILFTAKYVKKFAVMEETIKTGIGVNEAKELELKAKVNRAEAMRLNAQTRAFKEMKESIPKDKLSSVAFAVFGIKGLEKITGTDLGDFLPPVEKTYSASEVGNRLGITSNKVGRIATANDLKTDEYGIKVMDKSAYSSKEVPNFRYNEKGFEAIKEIVERDKVSK